MTPLSKWPIINQYQYQSISIFQEFILEDAVIISEMDLSQFEVKVWWTLVDVLQE